MSGAGVDPAERARILLMRGDELLAAGTPESLDEAMLAYEGGLEVAREPGVEDNELPRLFEDRIATVRRRLEPGADAEEAPDDDPVGGDDAEAAAGGSAVDPNTRAADGRDEAAGEPGSG